MSDQPAKRGKRWIVRILVLVIVLVVALPLVGYAGAAIKLNSMRNHVFDVQVAAFTPPEAPTEEGARLFNARGCADCHGANGAGRTFLADPALGTFHGANLTSGQNGLPADFTPQHFAAAVRHGLQPDGRPLVMMKAEDYIYLTNEEMGALWAHIRALPPVDTEVIEQKLGPLGTVLSAAGIFQLMDAHVIDHSLARPMEVTVDATPAYGEYLAQACRGCHGYQLSGGPLPGAPPSLPVPTNITPDPTGLAGVTLEQFTAMMRQGVRPDGSQLDPFMPVASLTSHLTDTEVGALYAYLMQLAPVAEGNR